MTPMEASIDLCERFESLENRMNERVLELLKKEMCSRASTVDFEELKIMVAENKDEAAEAVAQVVSVLGHFRLSIYLYQRCWTRRRR